MSQKSGNRRKLQRMWSIVALSGAARKCPVQYTLENMEKEE
ncbi:MAG: hypothetical protein ABFC78_10820 [Methanoregula sp.]